MLLPWNTILETYDGEWNFTIFSFYFKNITLHLVFVSAFPSCIKREVLYKSSSKANAIIWTSTLTARNITKKQLVFFLTLSSAFAIWHTCANFAVLIILGMSLLPQQQLPIAAIVHNFYPFWVPQLNGVLIWPHIHRNSSTCISLLWGLPGCPSIFHMDR